LPCIFSSWGFADDFKYFSYYGCCVEYYRGIDFAELERGVRLGLHHRVGIVGYSQEKIMTSLPCAVRRDEARYQREMDDDDKWRAFKDELHDIAAEIDDLVTSCQHKRTAIDTFIIQARRKSNELIERAVKEME
jgi:hypothetical protein